ncbi:MAG: argininosuccinate lyase [Eggerthellaceae bacterium]|nr:argininosuccinate lyase [Eggerthellaceae bacterium]
MPALQVRDFPDDMYEQLKECAAREHRSIAQQTIAFVEQGIRQYSGEYYWDGKTLHRPVQMLGFDTEKERLARIEKRKALFSEFKEIEWKGPKPTSEEMVEMLHEMREERTERILRASGFYDEAERAIQRESADGSPDESDLAVVS